MPRYVAAAVLLAALVAPCDCDCVCTRAVHSSSATDADGYCTGPAVAGDLRVFGEITDDSCTTKIVAAPDPYPTCSEVNLCCTDAGAACVSGKLVNVPDAYLDTRFNRDIDLRSGYRTRSVLCFPIVNSRDEVIAVIQLINKADGLPFNRADEELLAAFCAQLAVSIENAIAIAAQVGRTPQRRFAGLKDPCTRIAPVQHSAASFPAM